MPEDAAEPQQLRHAGHELPERWVGFSVPDALLARLVLSS